ncbi:hypothetical protein FACS1894104_0610 [Actinomycetota bacterium]|nr:hypothetical protein FACS1894104_0610 [Actinomycetota bacterium]
MSKELAIIHYRAAVSVFRQWLTDGLISEDEFIQIDNAIADKYGLPLCSIYR